MGPRGRGSTPRYPTLAVDHIRVPYADPNAQRAFQADWVARKRDADREAARAIERDRKRERIERIDAIKASTPCADCGGRFHPVAMDFDHVAGDKTLGISEMVRGRYSWQRIEVEIAKCEIVCSNCHRVRTYERL